MQSDWTEWPKYGIMSIIARYIYTWFVIARCVGVIVREVDVREDAQERRP